MMLKTILAWEIIKKVISFVGLVLFIGFLFVVAKIQDKKQDTSQDTIKEKRINS